MYPKLWILKACIMKNVGQTFNCNILNPNVYIWFKDNDCNYSDIYCSEKTLTPICFIGENESYLLVIPINIIYKHPFYHFWSSLKKEITEYKRIIY
jgi:hypothetical protein